MGIFLSAGLCLAVWTAAAQPAPAAERQQGPNSLTRPVIPRGASLRVRIDEEMDTRRNRAGDHFEGTLYAPVVVNGATVLPTGTRFRGHLIAAKPSGRLKGRAVLGLALDSFQWNGRQYAVHTSSTYRESGGHKKHDAAYVGGSAGVGAAVGGIAGGGVGAAVGALAGSGVGVAGAAFTGRKQVAIPAEAPLTFTLRVPVRL
jgi:hypothetical protein